MVISRSVTLTERYHANMKIAVIIPAAGLGKRFAATSGTQPASNFTKIEMDLLGRPVFLRAVELFTTRAEVSQIILAVNPDTLDEFKFRWGEKLSFMGVTLAAGGRTERWETVKLALQAVKPEVTHVAVHDAARPLTDAKVIDRVFEAAARYPAVIPGIFASATLKKVSPMPADMQADPVGDLLGVNTKQVKPLGQVANVVDRRDVVEVQTPQIFELQLLCRAYAQIVEGQLSGADSSKTITDDAMLVEALGEKVVVVEGASTNFKITRPEDLELARAWMTMIQPATQAATARKKLFADDED
ncbi:MAG: 2-C-methyl-D-erythritol 4-phosphate cytidylyltransferase [Phycisphaerales bacterium]|nr:2-C-methyl-D-erythritol 4-phosphate cytidylyltransferase [Phycisphaerales bacterium]